MSVLSSQSIRRLCTPPSVEEDGYPGSLVRAYPPLITPFTERAVVNGKSYGLSACTYDCRIAEDLVLEPMPFDILATGIRMVELREGHVVSQIQRARNASYRALASTMERFCLPANVCGSVLDKSSMARGFVSAFNTHLDPGWAGYLTVELVNLGDTVVTYKVGDPVCQIKFEWLDEPTDLPYGPGRKYFDQDPGPQAARYEATE